MFPFNLFPFNKDTKNMMNQMKPEEIDKYVQGLLGKVFPSNMQMSHSEDTQKNTPQSPTSHASIGASVYETHDYVFVRLKMDEDSLKAMKLYHTSNHMIVENIPNKDDKHTIVLPAIVKKKGASARYKDGMLEVKIPKNQDLQFSEIDVSEIM